jgi:hypothetical protein
MTIDERIEALTQSMELHVQITTAELEKLRKIAQDSLASIQALERIAASHESRISRIEDQQQ